MGSYAPPVDDVTPRHTLLPAGTVLWRVHDETREPNAFNDRPAHPYFGGGRFDGSAEDQYPFLYAGQTEHAALSEVVLRGIPFSPNGYRLVPNEVVRGRRLSALESTTELRLITLLTTQDLSAVGQNEWLVQAGENEYAQTRYWARWLRTRSDAQGMVWQSRLHRPDWVLILFGDRCGPDALKPLNTQCVPLGTPAGIAYLNDLLGPYRVRLSPPC